MWTSNDRPMGRIGLAIAAIGIVCGVATAHAQIGPTIDAQIGLVEFRVPKEFVTNWVKSRQHLSVEFSYPEIEPVGRFRFADENRQQWIDYQKSLVERGGNILYVTIDRIQNPKSLPEIAERERFLGAWCKILGIEKFDSYFEHEIDFFRCGSGSDAVAQFGYHRASGLTFRWDVHAFYWRASKRNLDERIVTEVRLRPQDLKDWKAITARAYAVIESWRK
jgi:hypothetical protein